MIAAITTQVFVKGHPMCDLYFTGNIILLDVMD